MIDYLTEHISAKINGDISDKLTKLGMDWDDLAREFNKVADRHTDDFTLKTLVESGEITVKELTTIMLVLKQRLLVTTAPLSSNDTAQASAWANS